MQYSKNYELNLPELADQFNLKHQNENTEKIDTQMKKEETDRTEADTALRNITDSVLKKALINLLYRKGSYYWTSDEAFDPNISWTGKWEKIEDAILMAKGKKFTTDGGNAYGTITLSIAQLPAHTHTMPHTHSISHTHSYKPSGTVSSHTHPFSANNTHSHKERTSTALDSGLGSDYVVTGPAERGNDRGISNGYNTYKSGRKFVYSGDTTITISGTTDPTTPKFTGSQATIGSMNTSTSGGASNSTTSSVGSGNEINIMPPYKVAICWHRTE